MKGAPEAASEGLSEGRAEETPALGAISAPFGGHAFTWPFVLTAMLFLAAAPAIPRLRPV
ncbi:hypothetical protein ACWC9T_26505 [Kitasatospora sp. NPDC001159]